MIFGDPGQFPIVPSRFLNSLVLITIQQVHILEPTHNHPKPTKNNYKPNYERFGLVPSLDSLITGQPDPFNISNHFPSIRPCREYFLVSRQLSLHFVFESK